MAFIKRHLVLVSCGSVGVLSIVAILAGVFVADVSADMQSLHDLLNKVNDIVRGGKNVVNYAAVVTAGQRYEKMKADREKLWQFVRATNARKLLNDRAFTPNAKRHDLYQFQEEYRMACTRLIPDYLKGKEPPGEAEVRAAQSDIDRKRREQGLAPASETGYVPAQPGLGPRPPGLGPGVPGLGPRPGPPPGGAAVAPGGRPAKPIEEEIETDAFLRATFVRAHETRCYATPPALYRVEAVLTTTDPQKDPMWDAQMTLWIQQDVLGALGKLNEEAAAKLPPENQWVAYMPVKELLAIRFTDCVYTLGAGVAAAGVAAASGAAETWITPSSDFARFAPPTADAALSFTHRTSNPATPVSPAYDVIPFALELVVDARAVQAVLDAICGVNFYIPTNVTWAPAPATTDYRTGRVYGASPLIHLRIEFEGAFFREFYHRLMPPGLPEQIVAGQRLSCQQGGLPGGSMAPPPHYAPPGGGTPDGQPRRPPTARGGDDS